MHKNSITGAEIIIQALMDNNVDVIFGYPGGAVLPIYDALYSQDRIRHILVRHEQGAVHAAEGYARSTGKVGVALVTSGPGATNAVTGLTDALMDSVPVVCLTGQVATHLIGTDAFQECDTTGITRSCTKHNYLVKDVHSLANKMHEAFYVARSGRPGPVVIDLPKDMQMSQGVYSGPSNTPHKTYQPIVDGNKTHIAQAVDIFASAKRPIIYGGGGIINSGLGACELLRKWVDLTATPTTLTLMGLGALPASNKHFLGMLGMHGTYEANHAMHQCDVMLCLGVRFDDRVTGRIDAFSPNSTKIHVDIDPSSFNKTVQVDLTIIGDAESVLKEMLKQWKAKKKKIDQVALQTWWKKIDGWREKKCLSYQKKPDIIQPQEAICRLAEKTKKHKVFITTEVGQHQMWAAQHFPFEKPYHWMTSGGLGTMGYGLPAAIGVQLGNPDGLVIDIAGEASILMNIQELSTALQYNLPVKIFILNNHYMGMVRQWQELLHGGRLSQTYSEALPDFVKLAQAYGGTGLKAEHPDQLDDVIDQMIETKGFVIADIHVDQKANCFPMIPSGAAHNEMLLGDETEDRISTEGKMLI